MKEACDSLDRLVDIDPYDYRNHERIAKLEGKADPGFLQNILARAAKAATVSTRTDGFTGAGREPSRKRCPACRKKCARSRRWKIWWCRWKFSCSIRCRAKRWNDWSASRNFFPARKTGTSGCARCTNARIGGRKARRARPASRAGAPRQWCRSVLRRLQPAQQLESYGTPSAPTAAETHRDLAAIAEINRLMYRQPTPREVLATTAAEIGKHLHVSRCLVAVGAPGEGAQATAEYFAPGFAAVGAAKNFQHRGNGDAR